MIQNTSLEAYKILIPELGTQQQIIYNVIIKHPNMSNHDIARYLHWEINRVTPRVKELRDKGLVVCRNYKEDHVTKKKVMCWTALC